MDAVITPHEGARFAPASAGTPKSISRLLALLLLACASVSAIGAPASAAPPACLKRVPPLNQQTIRADAVFVGVLGEPATKGGNVTYTVDVADIYKGDVGEEATVSTPAKAKDCGLPDLAVGAEYVVFGTADGDQFTTTADSGTARATPAHVAQVEQLLGPPRSPTPPETVEAEMTMVAEEAPTLQRLVAPGFALVLVGLLGLVLVSALGRRKG